MGASWAATEQRASAEGAKSEAPKAPRRASAEGARSVAPKAPSRASAEGARNVEDILSAGVARCGGRLESERLE